MLVIVPEERIATLRDGLPEGAKDLGLFVEALRWVLIIALVLFLASALSGYRYRSRRGPRP